MGISLHEEAGVPQGCATRLGVWCDHGKQEQEA